MDPDREAANIRRAMAQLRQDVDANAAEVATRARELTDWRHYVRAYPKTSLALAAAVGYLVVPEMRSQAVSGAANSRTLRRPSMQAAAIGETAVDRLLGTAGRLLVQKGLPLVAREALRWWTARQPGSHASSSSAAITHRAPNGPGEGI